MKLMPLTTEEINDLIRRNEYLLEIRAMYEPLWREIAMYEFPRALGPRWGLGEGQKQTKKQLDSTAEHSINLLAASMHGTLTPSSSIWSTFKLRDNRLNMVKEVMDWLEAMSVALSVARHQSNFNSQIHELYIDLVTFGQGCMLIEERGLNRPGFNGFQYTTLSNLSYCTAENHDGVVDTLFREFELSARDAVLKFGESNLPDEVKTKAKTKPDEPFKFIHAVFPNEDKNKNNPKPFVSYYILKEQRKLVGEGGYWEFPFIVPRWSKTSGEHYGRGPGHTALADVQVLCKAKELDLKAWAKDIDPPTFEKDQGVIGSLKLIPGGRNIVRDKDSIWTMDFKRRYDVTQIREEQLRQSIRQIFFSDQLHLKEGPEMTATEVQVRYELMQRLLGPAIGRFNCEGLNPLIEREFGLLMRANSRRYSTIPPPPEILAMMGVNEIDVEYEGPLAKSQRLSESIRIQRVFGFAGQIAPVYPDVFDNFDMDKAVRHIAEIEGAPSEIMRSQEELAQIRKMKAQQRAMEQQKQDLERLAQGAKNAAPAVETLSKIGKELAGEATP